ncbi:MAG: DUF4250 domain-containing protein [Clostridia bacterium]|nr:DUF4250 domain-containing protein [Clostridia bacterium]
MNLPADNFILLSVINTALRDKYSCLEDLCEEEELDLNGLCTRLKEVGYTYDKEQNAFKRV